MRARAHNKHAPRLGTSPCQGPLYQEGCKARRVDAAIASLLGPQGILRMASSQRRPRPRAKQPSVDVVQQVSPTDSQGSTLQSTLSPPPKPTRHVVDIDDDDDFFTRRRTAGQAPPVTFHASAMEMTGQEELSEGSQDEEAQTGDGSSDEDRRRKKGRRKMSSWTKTSSFSRQDLRRRSSSQARDGDKRSGSEGIVVDGQSGHEQGQQRGQRKRTRSPSLTPPPPLEKEGESAVVWGALSIALTFVALTTQRWSA